jgi:hypothetical protein
MTAHLKVFIRLTIPNSAGLTDIIIAKFFREFNIILETENWISQDGCFNLFKRTAEDYTGQYFRYDNYIRNSFICILKDIFKKEMKIIFNEEEKIFVKSKIKLL